MCIVVCVKQVKNLNYYSEKFNNNPSDLAALSWAMKLKRQYGFEVNTVSMASSDAISLVRQLYAYGVDKAILLTSPILSGSDTHATSYALGKVIQEYFPKYDLIVCGNKSLDGETGHVPHSIAVELDINSFSNVCDILYKDEKFEIHCELEQKRFKIKNEKRPLITVNKGPEGYIYLPRVKDIIGSQKKCVEVITCDNVTLSHEKVGQAGSFTKVVSVRQRKSDFKRKNKKIYFDRDKKKLNVLIKELIGEEL